MKDPDSDPALDLDAAMARMTWSLEPAEFTLVGFTGRPDPDDLALLAHPPAQLIVEEEETTLLVRSAEAADLQRRRPGAQVEGPLFWVRFDAPMGWEVVGFLARVTSALAAAQVPIGAVCSFSRDHLFVHVSHRERVVSVLSELFPPQ